MVIVTDGAAQLSGMVWYSLLKRFSRLSFGIVRPYKKISPDKTGIGFIGGLLLGGVAVTIVNNIVGGMLPWWFMTIPALQ